MELIKFYLQKVCNTFHELQPWIITIICFTCSAIYSIALWRSQGATEFSKNVNMYLALAIEMGKYFFPVVAITAIAKKKWTKCVCCLMLAAGCFGYSIAASIGFNLIELQQLKNESYKNSQAYINNQKYEQNKVSEIQQLETDVQNLESERQKELSRLEEEKQNEVSELQRQRDNWNPDTAKEGKVWIAENRQSAQKKVDSAVTKWNKKIEDVNSKYSEKLDSAKSKKSSLALEKNDTIFENTTDEKYGYDILFGSKENTKKFFMILAVLIELVGIGAAIEAQKYSQSSTLLPKFELPWRRKQNNTPAIGFKLDTNYQNNNTESASNILARKTSTSDTNENMNNRPQNVRASAAQSSKESIYEMPTIHKDENVRASMNKGEQESIREVPTVCEAENVRANAAQEIQKFEVKEKIKGYSFTNLNLREYVEYLSSNIAEDKSVPGYKKAANNLGFDNPEIIREMRNFLIVSKLLEGRGNKTYVIGDLTKVNDILI